MAIDDVERRFDELVKGLVSEFPSFQEIERLDGRSIVEGVYTLDLECDGVWFYDDYEIRIAVPYEFPRLIPLVWEISNKIPASYDHKYEDGSLCLGIYGEIALELSESSTLASFVDVFVRDALYSARYFYRFNRYPFGDRAHGASGILEFYKALFNVQDDLVAARLLYAVACGSYRGHLPCPCGSGEKGRNCHGPKILEMANSIALDAFKSDFSAIADKYVAEADAKRLERSNKELIQAFSKRQVESTFGL